jgi:hypothetical protein
MKHKSTLCLYMTKESKTVRKGEDRIEENKKK